MLASGSEMNLDMRNESELYDQYKPTQYLLEQVNQQYVSELKQIC
jgi:hypothetical protein